MDAIDVVNPIEQAIKSIKLCVRELERERGREKEREKERERGKGEMSN
jgi:hypothetical protein